MGNPDLLEKWSPPNMTEVLMSLIKSYGSNKHGRCTITISIPSSGLRLYMFIFLLDQGLELGGIV